MDLALWIVTGALAAAYVAGGSVKMIVAKERFAAFGRGAKWADDFSPRGFKAIGALEVLGALGLILPAVFDIVPVLVPLAALGLMTIMVGAVYTRIRRQEFKFMLGDLVYVVLFGFVAWGRFGPDSFGG